MARQRRQRESLYETATTLAGRMTISCFTSKSDSKILETQLEEAIRFFASEENPPAQKLYEKLSRINKLLATITDAVDVHCAQCAERFRISTPHGNPRTGPSSIYLNHPQLSTPAVFQQHADDGHSTSSSPEFIHEHHTEPLSGRTARKQPLESESSREGRRSGPTARKRSRDAEVGSADHLFFLRYTTQRMVRKGGGPSGGNRHGG
jgi:hypothetical protein